MNDTVLPVMTVCGLLGCALKEFQEMAPYPLVCSHTVNEDHSGRQAPVSTPVR